MSDHKIEEDQPGSCVLFSNSRRDRVKALEQSCDDLKNELVIATDKVSNLQGEKKVGSNVPIIDKQ